MSPSSKSSDLRGWWEPSHLYQLVRSAGGLRTLTLQLCEGRLVTWGLPLKANRLQVVSGPVLDLSQYGSCGTLGLAVLTQQEFKAMCVVACQLSSLCDVPL